MYDKYIASWKNKKQQILTDYLTKKIDANEAVNILNDKVSNSNLRNNNIRVSTPWNDLIRYASEYDDCKIIIKPQGDDTVTISVDGNDNAVFILEIAIKKSVNNLIDDSNLGTTEVTNRLMDYLNETIAKNISLRNLIKLLRTIDIGDIMS
jgi:hypothetical protein